MIIFQASTTECWPMKLHKKEKQFGQALSVVRSLLDHIDLIALVEEAYSHGVEKRQVIMRYTKNKDLDSSNIEIIKVVQNVRSVRGYSCQCNCEKRAIVQYRLQL